MLAQLIDNHFEIEKLKSNINYINYIIIIDATIIIMVQTVVQF